MFSKFLGLGSQEHYGEIAGHLVPRNCTDFLPIHYDMCVCMYMYIYMYMYICVCVCIYIYIYEIEE